MRKEIQVIRAMVLTGEFNWIIPPNVLPQKHILCDAEMRCYFDLPELQEMTVVLSDSYSRWGYEFRLDKIDPERDVDLMIEGERRYAVLFNRLNKIIREFLNAHGRCFLSLEYEA